MGHQSYTAIRVMPSRCSPKTDTSGTLRQLLAAKRAAEPLAASDGGLRQAGGIRYDAGIGYGTVEGRLMDKVTPVDVSTHVFDIDRNLSIATRQRKPGPPERVDGMTVGIVAMEHDAPHNGEVHPDGDEILYIISGRVRVTGDSAPDNPIELGPGGACIVRKGEWHKVSILEPTRLVHITPGPNGDHRPLR